MAIDVQSVSASVGASTTTFSSLGTYTVPAGENRKLIAVMAKGNANDEFKLEFNAGSNKNYQFIGLLDDDPSALGRNGIIPLPVPIDVPANSVVTAYAKNTSAAAVTTTVWLIFQL